MSSKRRRFGSLYFYYLAAIAFPLAVFFACLFRKDTGHSLYLRTILAILGSAAIIACSIISSRWALRRQKRQDPATATDERERMIREKADRVGLWALFLSFFLACMVPFYAYWFFPDMSRETVSIRVDFLPIVFLVGVVILFTVRAVTIRLLRGSDENADNTQQGG